MATLSRRSSQVPTDSVNLYCSQCTSQLGIFENEWIRLTASYMRPARSGQHFGTEIGQKTQIVPRGVSQQAVEGCTMAEVFCTKCSASVGQYCKATPTPEQRKLMNQYFYKSSKTYLTNGHTKDKIDPIFSYGGDSSQPSIRATSSTREESLFPRPSLPPVPRWSQTPSRSEQPPYSSSEKRSHLYSPQPYPPHFQPYPYSRSVTPAERSFLRHEYYDDAEQHFPPSALDIDRRFRSQESLIDAQGQQLQQHDMTIQTLSNQLDLFKRIVEELQYTVSSLQTRSNVTPVGPLGNSDFVGGLELMVAAMKNSQSGLHEIEALRAENEAMKAKLHSKASPSAKPGVHTESETSLGKRKRNSDVVTTRKHQDRALPETVVPVASRRRAPSTSIPTPQSSQNSDISSRTSQEIDSSALLVQSPNLPLQGTSYLRNPGSGTESPFARVTRSKTLHKTTRDAQISDTRDKHLTTNGRYKLPRTEVERINQGDEDAANDTFDANLPDHTAISDQPNGSNIEFSDNEMDLIAVPVTETSDHVTSTFGQSSPLSELPQDDLLQEGQEIEGSELPPNFDNASAVIDPLLQDENSPAIIRQGVHTRSSARRATDSAIERSGRSLAPEPTTRRRTLPRRVDFNDKGREDFDIAVTTPATLEQEWREGPKKIVKPSIQSTEKILNHELMELGLEEWIGKDKQNNPEYRKIIEAARAKKREENKRLKLASLGIGTLSPSQPSLASELVSTDLPSPSDSTQPPPPQGEKEVTEDQPTSHSSQTDQQQEIPNDASAQILAPLVNESNTRTPNATTDNSDAQTKQNKQGHEVGVLTRKKGRQAELRRRDQLAKQAMDMDD